MESLNERLVNRENEEALIGAVLKGGAIVYQRVKDIVKPEMFGNFSYGKAWNAIETLFERGLSIDQITVGDELERHNALNDFSNGVISGRNLLAEFRMLGDTKNAESYAENVQDYHVKKQFEEWGKKMVVWSKNGRRAPDIMHDMNKMFSEIILHSSKTQNHVSNFSNIVSMAYDETTSASKGLIKTVKTGLKDLDTLINNGFRKGNLVIVAARPGQGKTSFLLTVIFDAVVKENKRVLLFSLEMTAQEIGHRFLSMDSGIPLDRIISGKLYENEWSVFTNSVDKLSSYKDNLIVIDLGGIKIGNVRQFARKEHGKKLLDLVVLDYVQLANPDNKNQSRVLDVGEVSRGLKSLAKELDVPVLTAAQLSRAVEQRTDKRPRLSDLREAGDLEQDADIVIFPYHDEEIKSNARELIVAKHRNGRVGTTDAFFNPENTLFMNLRNDQ